MRMLDQLRRRFKAKLTVLEATVRRTPHSQFIIRIICLLPLLVFILGASIAMPVAAHQQAVEGSGEYAQVNIDSTSSLKAIIFANEYANRAFATSNLGMCRTKIDVIIEIQAHAIGQFATDPHAGLTCDQFIGV